MYKIFFLFAFIFLILGILTYLFHGNFFNLPGDIIVKKENFKLYFPITSMIILSVILSIIAMFISK